MTDEKRRERIEELKKRYGVVSLTVSANEQEKEYIRSLREWERRSKKSNMILHGPIR
jgi:hypothetical protein